MDRRFFVILLVFTLLITRFKRVSTNFICDCGDRLDLTFHFDQGTSALTLLLTVVFALRGKEVGGSISLAWLGFSYVAFRLLHTLLDRKAGRLSAVPLADYVNYVIFFPAFTAGPIDRLERFIHDLNNPVPLDRQAGWKPDTFLFRVVQKICNCRCFGLDCSE